MRRWSSASCSGAWPPPTASATAPAACPATVAWLTEELGELAQAVRKGSAEDQLHELGDVLAWLASLAEQLGLSLDDAVARYADGCPALRRVPCTLRLSARVAVEHGRQRLSGRRSASAIWMALRAAPLRRLSPERNSARPRPSGTVGSTRMRPTWVTSPPATSSGVGTSRQLDAVGAGAGPRGLRRGERPLEPGVDRQRVPGEHRAPARRATDTSRSGRSRILRLSLRSFCSSSVSSAPSSTKLPACGMTLKAIGFGNCRGSGKSTAAPSWARAAAPVADLAHLLVELGDAGQPAAGHGLVGAHDHRLRARPRGRAA